MLVSDVVSRAPSDVAGIEITPEAGRPNFGMAHGHGTFVFGVWRGKLGEYYDQLQANLAMFKNTCTVAIISWDDQDLPESLISAPIQVQSDYIRFMATEELLRIGYDRVVYMDADIVLHHSPYFYTEPHIAYEHCYSGDYVVSPKLEPVASLFCVTKEDLRWIECINRYSTSIMSAYESKGYGHGLAMYMRIYTDALSFEGKKCVRIASIVGGVPALIRSGYDAINYSTRLTRDAAYKIGAGSVDDIYEDGTIRHMGGLEKLDYPLWIARGYPPGIVSRSKDDVRITCIVKNRHADLGTSMGNLMEQVYYASKYAGFENVEPMLYGPGSRFMLRKIDEMAKKGRAL